MKWSTFLELPKGEFLTSGTKKLCASLQRRIDTLTLDRADLDKMEAAYKNAPLTETHDWAEVNRRYASLLQEELKLRLDIRPLYERVSKERGQAASKASEMWIKAQAELKGELLKLGWTEESLIGSTVLLTHPRCKQLRIDQQSFSSSSNDHSHEQHNAQALQAIENELTKMRTKMMI
jgi:hypothetical protein